MKNMRDEVGAVAAHAVGVPGLPATSDEAHADHVAAEHHNTRQRVVQAILENGPSTAGVLAKQLNLTPAAVRRHLDALLAEGLITHSDRRPPGQRGRGRPARLFALTDAGRDAFHQSYDDLAISALSFLSDRLGPVAVEEFARDRVAALADAYRELVGAAAPEDRVRALAQALSDHGYAATAREAPAGGGEQLCQHHCPVAHVAARFPQLCEAETEVFARLLGTHVQRLATIAHGDGVCTTHVPSQAPEPPPKRGRRQGGRQHTGNTPKSNTQNTEGAPIPASGRNTA